MLVSSISIKDPQVFKGKYSVRQLWVDGKLPSVKTDIYGLPLTRKTCSREHIIPKSLGGHYGNSNIALADKFANSRRSSEPLSKFTTLANVVNYFMQFLGVIIKDPKSNQVKFDGLKYFKSCIPSLKHEGFTSIDQYV